MTTETGSQAKLDALLDAAMAHVPFDGWSAQSFDAAVADSGLDPVMAKVVCPRGATGLAAAYHKRGDARMLARFAEADLTDMRYRDKIAALVRFRLEAVDREIVRRGLTLFSLPHLAPEGTRLVWETADAIWTALGDSSDDINWYTKRATLSGVFAATVVFWLGDDSEGDRDTWDFLDRRIDDVMQIEKAKAQVRDNKLLSGLFAVPNAFLSRVRAPAGAGRDDLPGRQTNG